MEGETCESSSAPKSNMQPCSIYKITNSKNNKVYVGQTWNTINKRFIDHKSPNAQGCIKLLKAFNKYGRDNFKIELITFAHTQEIANYWEQYFIQKYDSITNGYNIREGGSNGKMAEQTKIKLSEFRKGMKYSSETKFKMSKAKVGNKNSKNNKGNMGRKLSEETKKLIAQANMGTHLSSESKEKISKIFKGRTWKLINGKRVWI